MPHQAEKPTACLALADGTLFFGHGFGAVACGTLCDRLGDLQRGPWGDQPRHAANAGIAGGRAVDDGGGAGLDGADHAADFSPLVAGV